MSELSELYQDLILDHGQQPRNFGKLSQPCRSAQGHNPVCGDQLTLFCKIEDDKVQDIKFEGTGCAISIASASLMADHLRGRSVNNAQEVFQIFHKLLTSESCTEDEIDSLGKCAALSGVSAFPLRVKCATLAWHTFDSCVKSDKITVKTE